MKPKTALRPVAPPAPRQGFSLVTPPVPADDGPVTVKAATPAVGFRLPPPPAGFVPAGPPKGFVITGPFAGDMEPAPREVELCDHCLDGTPHPHLHH